MVRFVAVAPEIYLFSIPTSDGFADFYTARHSSGGIKMKIWTP